MRQIMSNTQKSDFLSRVVARCWIQRHLCFHGSHSKSASYSLQQRNKLESKSRSLFVTFICTRMHMHAHRQGDNELPTPAAASMPVRWFTVHQEMGRCSCKFWARAGAWFVSWTSWTKMFRGTFFYLGENCKKARLCSLKPHSPLNQHPRWKMSTVAYRWCTSWQKDQNITEG